MISVIIPNYNHALHLPQRIETVLNQTYPIDEIIILDDCSTDNSRDIIDEYAKVDGRIRIVNNEVNSGSTFKQWNKGISIATGDYIWIAESDDYSDVHFLEKLVSKLKSDSSIGLAYCGSWNVYGDSPDVEDGSKYYEDLNTELWHEDFVIDGIYLVRKFMSYRNIIPNASAVLFRRDIAQSVGPANEKIKLVGDLLFWADILVSSKVAFIKEPLNYFRHHGNNVRSKSLVNGVYFVEITYLLLEIQKYGEPDSYFFNKMVDVTLKMWFKAMVEYQIPLSRHYKILKNLTSISDIVKDRTHKELKAFLFSNNCSGLRQVLGDGFIYPFINKVKNK